MVGDEGYLYTIEGVTAAVLMVFTTYLMLNSVTLYSPGETHVIDMQMEQLGNDALAMMDTPDGFSGDSPLQTYLHDNNTVQFNRTFCEYLNSKSTGTPDNFNYIANVSFRYGANDTIGSYPYMQHGDLPREQTVKVTRYVYIPSNPLDNPYLQSQNRDQTVLLEVLLWRS